MLRQKKQLQTPTLAKVSVKKGAGDRLSVFFFAGYLVVSFLFALKPTDQLPSPTLRAITILIELGMTIGLIGIGVRVLGSTSSSSERSKWALVLAVGLIAGFGLFVIRVTGGPRVQIPPRSTGSSTQLQGVAKDLRELIDLFTKLGESRNL